MPIPVILAATAIAGIGLQAYGQSQSISAAKKASQYNQQIAASQQRQEALRQQQMELDARRRQRESIRQAQRARAQALAAAQAQGANVVGASGLPGGYGQISGEMNTQLLGQAQALELGRENFAESANISGARYGIASTQSQAAFGSGLASLGGALIQSMGPIGNLAGGFGPSTKSSSGGYNYNPYYGTGSSYGEIY